MPVTPFHMTFGAAAKPIAFRHFSFSIYCLSQIIIDLEALYYLLTEGYLAHRAVHTFGAAIVVGLVSGFIGKHIRDWGRTRWSSPKVRTILAADISMRAALISGLYGSVTHIFLDSIMHSDMKPFAPISMANPFFGLISSSTLYGLCFIPGVLVLIWFEAYTKREHNK